MRRIYLQLHLLVALLANTAILGRLITLPAPALVVWRTFLAAMGGAVFATVVRKRSLFAPGRKIFALCGVGMIVGLHWLCFFGAIQLANVSICLSGLATMLFFTAFTEAFFERRRVRPLEVATGLIVLAGIGVVAGYERDHIMGLALAVLSAFLAAIFPVLSRRLVLGGLDSQVMMSWQMAGAFLVTFLLLPCLVPSPAYAGLFRATSWDWVWLLSLAWICTVGAHTWHIYLLRHTSAFSMNLAINFEPIYGMLAAAVLFHDYRRLTTGFYAGTATILAANILYPLLLRRGRARPARQ